MTKKPSITYDLKDLNKLVKTLGGSHYAVKVGIMGGSNSRKDGTSNAEVGLAMEYGSPKNNVPPRSFLRMPLWVKSQQIVNMIGVRMLSYLLNSNKKQVLVELGIACETAIGEAFDSWGFSFWQSLKPGTIRRKIGKNPQPLTNTSQLKRSVSSVVEKKQ